MEISAALRNALEVGLGVLYMIGAGFNLAYTRNHGEEFYTSFADKTWFAPSKWFIRKFVVPYPNMFTTTLILFQLLVALALLGQGPYVTFGLLAGTVFCMYAVFVTNVPGAIVNLGLALIQFYLATSR
jgi:hypothetical protein